MKHTSILSNASVRFVALAGIMIFGVMNASHAQTGAMAQFGAPASAQGGSIVAQLSSRWGDAATGQRDSPPESGNAVPAQGTPDQASSPSVEQVPVSSSCRYATSEQESFFCKMRRIFYGRDTSGPNRDVDQNISAGGAGG